MQLHSITVKGIGPLTEEVTLDLDALGDAQLVAIVGDPGEGKSTLMETALGALDPRRQTATRGSFDALADGHGSDSFVEAVMTYGPHKLRVRHEVGLGKSWLWQDGVEIKSDGKVSKVGEWLKGNVLPPEVHAAALALPQKSEGLIAALGTERRESLLKAIGIDEIEALAEKARKIHTGAKKQIVDHGAEIERWTRESACLPKRVEDHAFLTSQLAAARARREEAEGQLAVARAAVDVYQARERARAAGAAEREGVERRLFQTTQRLADLDARRTEQTRAQAEGETIRVRAARARTIAPQLVALREGRAAVAGTRAGRAGAAAAAMTAARAARGAGESAAAEQDRVAEIARGAYSAARDRVRAAEEILLLRTPIAEAIRNAEAARAEIEATQAFILSLEGQLGAARAAAAATTVSRIGNLRGSLEGIEGAARLATAKSMARGGLDADGTAERGVEPSLLDALEEQILDARARERAARDRLGAAERMASRSVELEPAEATATAGKEEMARQQLLGEEAKRKARTQREAATIAWAVATKPDPQDEALDREIAEFDEKIAGLDREAVALDGEEAREAALATIEAQIGEIDVQLLQARTEESGIRGELAALPPLPEAFPRPAVEMFESTIRRADEEIEHLLPRATMAEHDQKEAEAALAKLRGCEVLRPLLEEVSADWGLLAECLGITGVQALEIDAAGPELTANFNEFLHRAYGPRFTGEVHATRASKDGKKQINECEILVLDTMSKGQRTKRDVRTFSGGQRVHLSTAFFLALARYICSSRKLTNPTLILDEPGAGLSEATVGAWVDMVRYAARMIGASRVLVITHDSKIIDASDCVVRVHDGELSVLR